MEKYQKRTNKLIEGSKLSFKKKKIVLMTIVIVCSNDYNNISYWCLILFKLMHKQKQSN